MAFSIFRRALGRAPANSGLNECPQPVRRNAATIWTVNRPFSSDSSSVSPSGLSNLDRKASVTALLRGYGFTDADISQLERRNPPLFTLRAEKNLLPKFKFFGSIGFSTDDCRNFVMRNPFVLSSSLEKQIIPCYNYLKNLPIHEEKLVKILKLHPGIIRMKVETTIAPNVELLRGIGVSLRNITYIAAYHSYSFSSSHAKLKSTVEQALEMGLNPSLRSFVKGIHVMCGSSKETWKRKMKVYRSFGLSDNEILEAFGKLPMIMAMSEEKIAKIMEFFIGQLKWTPSAAVKNPVFLTTSLERRVLPRCRVVEMLKKKGLLKKATPISFLIICEEKFLNKYIICHKNDVPELLDIYSNGLPSQSKGDLPLYSD